LIEDGRVRASARLGSDEEIVAWLRPAVAGDAVVAIDAPLIVRNLTGRRRAEQIISRCFGAYHASAHSANLGLAAFRDGVRGEWLAAALGLSIDPDFSPGERVRRAIEVYPHTAIVALFDLPSTLKYKARPGRTLESRATALEALLDLLESLVTRDPPVDVGTSPRWQELRRIVAAPRTGTELAMPRTRSTLMCARIPPSTTGHMGRAVAESPVTRAMVTSSHRLRRTWLHVWIVSFQNSIR
jgi:predicted RNase H-like nuclease